MSEELIKTKYEIFGEKIRGISQKEQEVLLWKTLEALQGKVFYTAKGLEFSYVIRGGELFVDRKNKSITSATVNMAFHRARELNGDVCGPKMLGTFGASYLYPVFIEIGVIRRK